MTQQHSQCPDLDAKSSRQKVSEAKIAHLVLRAILWFLNLSLVFRHRQCSSLPAWTLESAHQLPDFALQLWWSVCATAAVAQETMKQLLFVQPLEFFQQT